MNPHVPARQTKDDVARIVGMYGRPDSDSVPEKTDFASPSTRRMLEYASAGVLFTFALEVPAAMPPRWNLLVITDLCSRQVMTTHAAAQRLLL